MDARKIQKYYVNQKEAVAIQCRSCGTVRTVAVDGLKDRNHRITINCPCTETFAVALEFRQDFRQKTHIIGSFRAVSTPKERARHCIIADQSDGGLLLHVTEEVPIKRDDQVVVRYPSENSAMQDVEKIISVRHFNPGRSIGGAFIDTQPPRDARSGNRAVH